MFGGKKEKILEQELSALRESDAHSRELFGAAMRWKDDILERSARMTASQAQLWQKLEQVQENMQHTVELAGSEAAVAGEIHNVLVTLNNDVGTFAVNHSVFLKQVRGQNEIVTELAEKSRGWNAPLKELKKTSVSLKEETEEISGRMERMREFSRNIGVLSLNAAIAAGRMGESGSSFINAAEEIRSCSGQYEKEAGEMEEHLAQSKERIAGLEEQVQELSELLKETSAMIGELYKNGIRHTAAYEGGQKELLSLLPENMIGRVDALCQSAQENVKTAEQMMDGIGEVLEELKEQKKDTDELAGVCRHQLQSAEQGKEEQ